MNLALLGFFVKFHHDKYKLLSDQTKSRMMAQQEGIIGSNVTRYNSIFRLPNISEFRNLQSNGKGSMILMSDKYCGSDALGEFFNFDFAVFYFKEPFTEDTFVEEDKVRMNECKFGKDNGVVDNFPHREETHRLCQVIMRCMDQGRMLAAVGLHYCKLRRGWYSLSEY